MKRNLDVRHSDVRDCFIFPDKSRILRSNILRHVDYLTPAYFSKNCGVSGSMDVSLATKAIVNKEKKQSNSLYTNLSNT
jgi:hypothetical protein